MLLLLLRPYGGGIVPPPPVIVIDTHDGAEENRLYRQKRERLREQIRMALEGPMPESTPEIVREVIAEQPVKPTDYRPILDEVLARIESYEAAERDDEDVLLLMH
jgi:hypothetical protein